MGHFRKTAFFVAAAMLCAALPVSVESKEYVEDTETGLSMDFNSDTVYGASDIRRLESFIHGDSDYDGKITVDRAMNASDLAILKRLTLAAERIKKSESLPVAEMTSKKFISGYFVKSLPKNTVISSTDELKKFYDGYDEYRADGVLLPIETLLEKYDDKFFGENSLVMAFRSINCINIHALSLADDKLEVVSFGDYCDGSMPSCYVELVSVSKDLLYLCDFSEVTERDCAKKYSFAFNEASEDDALFSATSIKYSVEVLPQNIYEWIADEAQLEKLLKETLGESLASVYGDEAQKKTDEILALYDSEFFKDRKLLTVSTHLDTMYSTTAYYSSDALAFHISGYSDMEALGSDFSVCFIAVKDELYNELPTVYFDDMIAADKPVIYLYPEEETEVTVSLDVDGKITCVYPEFTDEANSSWRVTASPDGTLTAPDGSQYSYLFWEAAVNAEWDMSKGYIIKGSDTLAFLREILPQTGLTAKEYNDFIVYWLPLMRKNEYNFVTFQTEAYTDTAKLEINPSPDSLLRVFMAYMPISADEAQELDGRVSEPELTAFERVGFTAVEWGGTEITRSTN